MRYYLAVEIKLDLNYYNAAITHDFALLCTTVQEVFGRTLETEEKKKELKRLISRARVLNDLRVKIVHGNWWPDHEGGTLLHVSRRTLREDVSGEMTAHLETQADLMRELFWALQILLSHASTEADDQKESKRNVDEIVTELSAALDEEHDQKGSKRDVAEIMKELSAALIKLNSVALREQEGKH
jgi:hypothetical protein